MIRFFIAVFLFLLVLAASVYERGAQQFTDHLLYWSVVAALAVLIGVYLYVLHYFVSYLREHHPATWANLGRPVMQFEAMAQNPRRTFGAWGATFKFLLGGQHGGLGDPRLGALIWSIRTLLGLNALLFALVLVLAPRA